MSQTQKSSQRNIWKRLRKNKGAIFGMIVIIVPINSYKQMDDSLIVEKFIDEGIGERVAFPFSRIQAASQSSEKPWMIKTITFWLGTDKYGRDILSRLLIGVRVSLAVGLITVIISLTIGVIFGAIAGYFGGVADDIIMWLLNIIWSIPTLLLVFAITLVLGKGFW